MEPEPFSPDFYHHKFKRAGLRYELVVSLSGNIIAVDGPFPAGKCSDLCIFRQNLKMALDDGEKILADKAYQDSSCITPQLLTPEQAAITKRYRARHEKVNSHIKK